MKYIYMPPKGHRGTANKLAAACGLIKIPNSADRAEPFRIREEDFLLINWGNTGTYNIRTNTNIRLRNVINGAENIYNAVNKLETYRAFEHFNVPSLVWTIEEDEAKAWHANGHIVYARKLLSSSQGKGIVIQDPNTPWIEDNYKVFTQRFKGKEEYRLHIFEGETIFTQQKKKKQDSTSNGLIKNVENGYVFAIQNVEAPEHVHTACKAAVRSLGLSFGAVDVGYAPTINRVCVYEVNTRPAISGSCFNAYVSKINSLEI